MQWVQQIASMKHPFLVKVPWHIGIKVWVSRLRLAGILVLDISISFVLLNCDT